MKKFLDYLYFSQFEITLYLNPLKWYIVYFDWKTYSDMDPGLILETFLRVGPIRIALIIDDGSW